MITCQWCNKLTDSLKEYGRITLCEDCYNKVVVKKICRKCGASLVDKNSNNGLCDDCFEQSIEDAIVDREMESVGIEECEMFYTDKRETPESIMRWLKYDPDKKGPTPDDFRKSYLLRRLYILLNLRIHGVTDEDVINDNMEDIDYLVDKNVEEIIAHGCKILIKNHLKDEKIIESEVIDYINQVYLCRVVD